MKEARAPEPMIECILPERRGSITQCYLEPRRFTVSGSRKLRRSGREKRQAFSATACRRGPPLYYEKYLKCDKLLWQDARKTPHATFSKYWSSLPETQWGHDRGGAVDLSCERATQWRKLGRLSPAYFASVACQARPRRVTGVTPPSGPVDSDSPTYFLFTILD